MESKVTAPAIALMVASGLSALLGLVGLAMRALGIGLASLGGSADDRFLQILGGAVGIVWALIGLAVQGFIFFGALKMKSLESYGIAVAGAACACIPCFGCCCWNVPVGVWALIVLMNAEVKAAFAS